MKARKKCVISSVTSLASVESCEMKYCGGIINLLKKEYSKEVVKNIHISVKWKTLYSQFLDFLSLLN